MPRIPRFLRALTLALDALLLLLLLLSQFTTPHLWLGRISFSSARDYLLLALLPRSYTTFTFESPLPRSGCAGLFRLPQLARFGGITYCVLPWWLPLLTTALLSTLLFWATKPRPSTAPAFPLEHP